MSSSNTTPKFINYTIDEVKIEGKKFTTVESLN